ncbi:hypothetical protein BDV12DRAFT_205676 [Aspergillus spectabilis]
MKDEEITAATTDVGNVGDGQRGFIRFLDLRNLVSFLWLGPALAILILNFRGHIIGSGLNCRGHCRIDPYSTSQVEQIDRLDGTNRDVVGALQFVAKGLEVWFMYVAAGFIYTLAVYLSSKDHRLPISLLLVYAEFMDLLYLKDLAMRIYDLLKEKGEVERNSQVEKILTSPPLVLYIFIAAVAALCVVANLMGVATATLIIPALQWIDINQDGSLAFGTMLSSQAPDNGIIALCEASDFDTRTYNCTSNLYAASLDELVEAAVATERQSAGRSAVVLPPVSQEANMTFSANVTDSVNIRWVANRQLLREFSSDLANYYLATTSDSGTGGDYPDSHRFNQSLQALLSRVGPTIGLTGGCFLHEGAEIFEISDDREVRCYGGLATVDRTLATKCIPWGSGWADSSAASSTSFTIQDGTPRAADMDVAIYTTPRARYLRDTTCLGDRSCDWERIFSDPADPIFANISNSQQTFEYVMPAYTESQIWCDNTAFLSFAAYAIEPSPVSNLLQLVQLGVLHDHPGSDEANTDHGATISFHVDWMLAAWSVNAADGVVPFTRGSSARFVDAFQRFASPEPDPSRFNLIHAYTIMQAASLIPYTTTPISTDADRDAQAEQEDNNPYTSATLRSWATVQLWKFGIDSRTKTLGVVVFIIGMVVVVATTIFWIESPKSPTRIVVTALLHEPPKEKLKDEETGLPLKVRFRCGDKWLSRMWVNLVGEYLGIKGSVLRLVGCVKEGYGDGDNGFRFLESITRLVMKAYP